MANFPDWATDLEDWCEEAGGEAKTMGVPVCTFGSVGSDMAGGASINEGGMAVYHGPGDYVVEVGTSDGNEKFTLDDLDDLEPGFDPNR